jgi:hypothetical protein
MQTEIFNSVSGCGKDAISAAKELVEINSRLMSKVLESQISLANLYVEGSEKQLEVAKGSTDPKEFIAGQTALVEEFTGKLTEAAQANAAVAQGVSEELKTWFEKGVEKGVKTADEAVQEAVKVATAA